MGAKEDWGLALGKTDLPQDWLLILCLSQPLPLALENLIPLGTVEDLVKGYTDEGVSGQGPGGSPGFSHLSCRDELGTSQPLPGGRLSMGFASLLFFPLPDRCQGACSCPCPSPRPGWGHQEGQTGTSGTGIARREGPRDGEHGPVEESPEQAS